MFDQPTNAKSGRITWRARFVFPVAAPPISGGYITCDAGRIVAVGANTLEANVEDLGEVAIIPGLVNTHTHLEFSDLAAPLGTAGSGFATWISQVTASRGRETQVSAQQNAGAIAQASADAITSQPLTAVDRGVREVAAAGTTGVGEIAVTGWSPAPFENAPLDAIVFRELICLSPERIPAALGIAEEHLKLRPSGSWRPGLSPHAPYTVHPELFAKAIDRAAAHQAPVAFHLAESPDELELLRSGTGPFFDYLSGRGFWVPGAIPPGTRPLDYLRHLVRAPRSLVVHANFLAHDELEFIAAHRDRLSVVYCPRTHAYFGHPRHPLEQLLARGAQVALGTDSRASNPDLNLLAEMRHVARAFPQLSGAAVLRLGTLSGAEALGLDDSVGSITAGRAANLAVIPIDARTPADPHELLFDSDADCSMTIYRGRVVCRREQA